jgi:hypothetical protein
VLDAVEAASQDQRRDDGRGQRHRHEAVYAEQLGTRRHTGELRARGADVRHDQQDEREATGADAVPAPDQTCETLTGDDTHAGTQVVEEHQRHRR